MEGRQPFVQSRESVDAFRALFLSLYGVREPLLQLSTILHWADVTKRLGLSANQIEGEATWVFGGYFYNIWTAAPALREIEQQITSGLTRGARQFLVPTVRNSNDAHALRDHGFQAIPWFIECIYEIRDGLIKDLNAQLGRHRVRSIERVAEKAAQRYPAREYRRADLEADPSLFELASDLHQHNVTKYGHSLNFYSASALRHLCASCLGGALLLRIRRDWETGRAVQMSMSLIDRARGQLYWLVHGIARDADGPTLNLFVAEAFDLLVYAERSGLHEINLSRGGVAQKLHLGANKLNLLNNWVRVGTSNTHAELMAIRARAEKTLNIENGALPCIGGIRVQ